MANISDGYGTITVRKVGKEFLEFINKVQDGAYYLLVDSTDGIEPDENGDVSFTFGAGGRWNYESNIDGYLRGNWMNGDAEKVEYDKFIKAFIEKEGSLSIEYTDSDVAMDWMGDGFFEMTVENGDVEFSHSFEEENITLKRFAEKNGESTYWALEYIYGDDIAAQYDKYAEKAGKEAVEPDVWFETIYEAEV